MSGLNHTITITIYIVHNQVGKETIMKTQKADTN